MGAAVPPVFVELPKRGLITVSGHDCFSFLQGLISHDINLLKTQPALYACLLTPNGKFLFDFFITQQEDRLLIECESGERAAALLKRLQMFRLRADVTFEIEEHKQVFAILFCQTPPPSSYPDPRHQDMGYRSLTPPADIKEAPFEVWDTHRIKLTIPDGSRDMIPEKSTLLECGIDKLNGVSFDKGCYMGQELTARMHYRGLAKKALYPVEFTEKPPVRLSDIKDKNDKVIGDMRSSCGNVGLVLMKKDAVHHLNVLYI